MYKVELTEKEVRVIGEIRWKRENESRYFWWCLGLFFVMLGFLGSPLIGMPEWASVTGCVLSLGAFFFVAIRMIRLTTKAGKKFVQSLKEVK